MRSSEPGGCPPKFWWQCPDRPRHSFSIYSWVMADDALSWGIWVTACGLVLLLGACGPSERSPEDDRPRVVTTIPPFEMILRPIVGGRGTVERLLEPGASPHTYDPSPSDLQSVRRSAVLVYGADHLDGWAADLPASRPVALLDMISPEKGYSFKWTGQGRGVRDRIDPHFWMDPQVVESMLPAMVDTLCTIDGPGCTTYRSNADSFATTLSDLRARLDTMMEPVRDVPVLLAQPFFRYFLRQYGPRLVGVVEPRPGVEPTPREIENLLGRAQTSNVRYVLTQRQLSSRSADILGGSADLRTVPLDPLGGVEGRRTYSELLLHNAQVLRDTLLAEPNDHGRSEGSPD